MKVMWCRRCKRPAAEVEGKWRPFGVRCSYSTMRSGYPRGLCTNCKKGESVSLLDACAEATEAA